MKVWGPSNPTLAQVVRDQTDICLKVYARDPSRVLQDANNERRISEGGYATRQLEELIQNAVDAASKGGGHIEVLLTQEALYVANDGAAFDEDGVRSVMASDVSTKDDERIGKFGIGFKSVLAISQNPKVLSRSVSFAFDKSWAQATLRGEGYSFDAYPTMRLAKTIDADTEAEKDPNLPPLMSWASTIIVAPLATGHSEISHRLFDFRSEFVLFSEHVKSATLRNETGDGREPRPGKPRLRIRKITQSLESDGLVTLRVEGHPATRWAVARSSYNPSPDEIEDGGYVAGRSQVELQYATRIPPASTDRLGSFWAYFPTRFATTLSGLINAPFKLSDDRTGLLEGRFNMEMLNRVPELVGDAVQLFTGSEHAKTVLDLYPARGDEGRNWADDYINDLVYDRLRSIPSLPNGDDDLCVPRTLNWVNLNASNEIENNWLESWAAMPGAPLDKWVHPHAYRTTERIQKVDRLKRTNWQRTDKPQSAVGIDVWLSALVHEGTVERSANAIALAAQILDDNDKTRDFDRQAVVRNGVMKARLIRLENGTLAAPHRGRVFVRVDGDTRDGVEFVDAELAAMPGVRENLAKLGVVVMDRAGELRALLDRVKSSPSALASAWATIWPILRELPVDTALRILREDLGVPLESTVRVRAASGDWVTIDRAFLAGIIVPAEGTRDRAFLIDPVAHGADDELLRELGAVEAPGRRHGAPGERWMDDFRQMASDAFIDKQKGSKPDPNKLVFDGPPPPWPMQPLTSMSEEARAAVTEYLLARGLDSKWTVKHETNRSYGQAAVVAPVVWFLRKHGLLRTEFGLMKPNRVLRAQESIDPRVLPAIELSEAVAQALVLREDPSDYTVNDWNILKSTADRWTRSDEDDVRRAEFYSWLPGNIEPGELVVRVGRGHQRVKALNVGVTADASVYESMLEAQIPVLLANSSEDADRFVELWGMPKATDLLQEEIIVEPLGEASYLTDEFPPLKLFIDFTDADIKIQSATRIVKMVATPNGQVPRPIPARRDGDVIFVTASDDFGRLQQVSTVLALGLETQQIGKILEDLNAMAVDQHRARVRAAADDDHRLLEAVGVEALRRTVPAQALSILEQRPGGIAPTEVAALARSVHGVTILKQLRAALEEQGLQPPKEWAGRRVTRQWVDSLGFPPEWAGFASSARPAVEFIDGPAVLGGLHNYQEFVTERITALLRSIGSDRGMVSLPTGAGKTRVTVQALIDGIRDGDISTDVPLMWIAQTDELCEQAAETWTYVWRAIGPQLPMRLGRLWATNEVPEEPGVYQLVIATIQKLDAIVDRGGSEYDWLRDPSVVVIDEAHASITSSYSSVLEWLGRKTRGRSKDERRPLIGLTATPFRGVDSDVETKRLVARYDSNRLDRGAFLREDPYEELQEMGVLANVRQTILDGVDVNLSPGDVEEIERLGRIPVGIAESLGANELRTLRVADAIAELPGDWTVLAFAPSVENSRVLAALLSHRGVPAVSISSDTETAARRYYIDEFKAGRIRVLTNFGVLAQGFDAPKVQAVVLARPTFSPNVYQQMVGRGLRGPRNGGSEEVLIVNVRDNFSKYGDRLAFNQFEYLWNPRESRR
ncbi:sacsin N-terminal ATP-binding-like domain-containing protein [Microbacterium sp. NPDC056003]|uniref:sacsin N-terminal ATP-binding-like domain-containing protein n=1 Tax=Microbacterium sp. NPDC056003 TaxID=3345676 RepID=UPI0035D7E30D